MHHHRRPSILRRFAALPPAGKAAVVALAAGGLLRILQVWAARALSDPACVDTALSARRLAHGVGYTFLGPAPDRLGAIETAVGGMLFTAFGESGFVLALATALFSFAALWALWRWARSAAGETGGLLALLAALAGPPGFFALQAAPHGGWMAALAFECILLAHAVRLADDIRDRWEPSATAYAGLGLLAGVALWASRLTLPAFLVAAWVLCRPMNGRLKKHWRGLLAATAGFLPGLAAWLFGLIQSGGAPGPDSTPLRERLAEVAHGFLRFGGAPAPLPILLLLLLLVLAGFCLAVAAARRRHAGGHHEHNPPRSSAAALALLYPVWLVLAAPASAAAGRPWILWLPPAAILAAVSCTLPRARWFRRAATAALILATVWQLALAAASLRALAVASSRLAAEHRAVAAALADRQATALYAPMRDYPLNFRIRETVAVTDGSPACAPSILRKAELARTPAWDAAFPGIADWMRTAGASADTFAAAGRTFFLDPQAPVPDLRDWPSAPRLASAPAPVAPLSVLADGRLDTWLEARAGSVSLEWTFPSPVSPAAIRLLFGDRDAPSRFALPGPVRVEFLRDGVWTPPLDLPLPPLETSLGRPYPPSPLHYRLVTLPAPRRPADAIRVTLTTDPATPSTALPLRLAEAALFTDPASPSAHDDLLPFLLSAATLSDLRYNFSLLPPDTPIFAPRRLSGILASPGVGAIAATRLGGIPEPSSAFSPDTPPFLIPGDRTACLCVETRLADAARLALGAADRPAETTECGPWTLFLLAPPDLEKSLPGIRLRWAGDLPVADLDFREVDRITDLVLAKLQGRRTRRNEWLKSQYEADIPSSTSSSGIRPSEPSVSTVRWREETAPDDPDAAPDAVAPASDAASSTTLAPSEERKVLRFIRQLSLVRPQSLAVLPEEIVYQAGGTDLLDLRARTATRPARPLETVFRDGILLQGIDAEPSIASPGAPVTLTLYWRASGAPRTAPETTCVRICAPDGRPVAAAEWTGLANAPGLPDFSIPLRENQTELVTLDLPADLPPGPLQIQVSRQCAGCPVPVKSTRAAMLPDASAAVLEGILQASP